QDPGADPGLAADADPSEPAGLQQQLWAAASLLPPTLVGRPPSRWRLGGRPGSSSPPSGPPWSCGIGAVSSRAVIGPWPGVTPIICGTGSMAARPTCGTWPWAVGPIAGRSMRGAGG